MVRNLWPTVYFSLHHVRNCSTVNWLRISVYIEKLYDGNGGQKETKRGVYRGERMRAGCKKSRSSQRHEISRKFSSLEREKFLPKTLSRLAWKCLRRIQVYCFDESWTLFNRTFEIREPTRSRDILACVNDKLSAKIKYSSEFSSNCNSKPDHRDQMFKSTLVYAIENSHESYFDRIVLDSYFLTQLGNILLSSNIGSYCK